MVRSKKAPATPATSAPPASPAIPAILELQRVEFIVRRILGLTALGENEKAWVLPKDNDGPHRIVYRYRVEGKPWGKWETVAEIPEGYDAHNVENLADRNDISRGLWIGPAEVIAELRRRDNAIVDAQIHLADLLEGHGRPGIVWYENREDLNGGQNEAGKVVA